MKRDREIKLNAFEIGWLSAVLMKNSKRMLEEVPALYYQFQINFCRSYAESKDHPLQEQAQKEIVEYQKKLDEIYAKENTEEKK